MNPFMAFLILAPLLVALLFWAGAVWGIITRGLAWDIVVANVLFAVITFALIYLLVKTSRSSMLDDKELERIDDKSRKKLTNSTLAIVYITIIIGLSFITNNVSVRYWLGTVSTLMALSIIWSGLWELKQARKVTPGASTQMSADMIESRKAFLLSYAKTRNFLLLSSVLTAISTGWVFWRFNGERFVSVFDFLGVMIAMASINFWFIMKGKSERKTMRRKEKGTF